MNDEWRSQSTDAKSKEIQSSLVTEIRDLGDRKTIVLYTNDNLVYRKVVESVKPLRIVPYQQEQKRGNLAVVGVDLYFPKEYRKRLEKNISTLQKVKGWKRRRRNDKPANECYPHGNRECGQR